MHKGDKINCLSTIDQFLTIDFASRCTVVGMQFGCIRILSSLKLLIAWIVTELLNSSLLLLR